MSTHFKFLVMAKKSKQKLREYYNIRCFRIPKSSKFFHNCEDNFKVDNYENPKLIATADGCGSTFVADVFSKNLMTQFPQFAKDIFNKKYQKWHETVTKDWLAYIETKPKKNLGFLYKFANKVAGSTFLGIRLRDNSFLGKVDIAAIGDSCLFQVRGNRVVNMFPKIKKFSGVTYAIQTSSNKFKLQHTEIEVHHGDTLILATDGVAEWIFNNPKDVEEILLLKNNSQFLEFIETYRKSKEKWLEDDDSTLIIIDVVAKSQVKPPYYPSKDWEKEYDEMKNKELENAVAEAQKVQKDEIEFEVENTTQKTISDSKEKEAVLGLLDTYNEKQDAQILLEIIVKLPKGLLELFTQKIKNYYGSNNNTKSHSK